MSEAQSDKQNCKSAVSGDPKIHKEVKSSLPSLVVKIEENHFLILRENQKIQNLFEIAARDLGFESRGWQ